MDPEDPLAATALAKLGGIALQRGFQRDAESLLTKAIRIWTTTPHVYEATDLAATQSLLAEVHRLSLSPARTASPLPATPQCAVPFPRSLCWFQSINRAMLKFRVCVSELQIAIH
jgi:hypothetical protein